eukprot:196139-Pleurochrysis_carterae.AAC.1
MQASHIFGKMWELSLILPMLKTGANFGATTFLTSIVRLMRNNLLPSEKRRLVRASDVRLPQLIQHFPRTGGSENVSLVMHALHATLVHRGVVDEIIWA